MAIQEFFYNFKNKRGLFDLIQSLDPTKLWRIRIDAYDARTLDQNAKMHAMLNDIAVQSKHLNKTLDLDSWKRLCIAQFRVDSIENDVPRIAEYWKDKKIVLMPSLDGSSLVALGNQSREFPKYVMAGFFTWLMAYGDNHNIVWSEPPEVFDEKYLE